MEVEEDSSDYNSDGDYCYDSDYDLYEEDAAFDSEDTRRVNKYSILKEEDIRQLQDDDIARVSAVLSISKVAASIVLCHYSWSVSKVEESWFADEETVRRTVGLLENPLVRSSKARKLTCQICFDSWRRDTMDAAACSHSYCSSCWTGYITTSINDGPGCVSLRCPDPSCSAAVDQDMINRHASDEDKDKYSRFLLRSYVEDNKETKWCPAPGCECAIDISAGKGEVYDVTCLCTHNFCWNCTEDAHRPVDCITVRSWILKNNSESENVTWILANSKPCPKCKRPIEKNHGCMHMTCTPPCKFEFCWLCLGDWSDHGEKTGGYYHCNTYNAAKNEGSYDEIERRREMAKRSLERYTHYYERWEANQSSREKALAALKNMQNVHLDQLIDKLNQHDLNFVTEAWLQIIECRRVLKWSYAYGYYLPEQELAKRQLFEYLQGDAESGLERLHQCAETELEPFLNDEATPEDFNDFRSKLTSLTSVTRHYFENLVEALENGLEDVDAHVPFTKTIGSSQNGQVPNKKGKGGKGKRAKSRGSSENVR